MKNWIINKLIKYVTRLDIINYNSIEPRNSIYGINNIELQLQDNGKTLKIFINLSEQNQQEGVTNETD